MTYPFQIALTVFVLTFFPALVLGRVRSQGYVYWWLLDLTQAALTVVSLVSMLVCMVMFIWGARL